MTFPTRPTLRDTIGMVAGNDDHVSRPHVGFGHLPPAEFEALHAPANTPGLLLETR